MRGAASPRTRRTTRTGPAEGPSQAFYCRGCGHFITDREQRIEVQGGHEHRFMNLAGFVYHIGCFAEALGCRLVGPDSTEYPWFAGFAWRYAHCAGCGGQLGWHFRNPTGFRFFGLIVDRLECRARPS